MGSIINNSFVNYYTSSHLRGRTFAASLWTVVFLPVGLFLLVLFSSFQPLSPYTWLIQCLQLLMSIKFWAFSLLAIASTLPLMAQHVEKFKVFPSISIRRVDHLLSFHPSNITLSFCYLIFSIFASFIIVSLFSGLRDEGAHPENSDILLFLRTSVVLACYLPFHFEARRLYQYHIPLIHLPKLVQAKTNLKLHFFSTFHSSIWLTLGTFVFHTLVFYPQASSNSLLRLFLNRDDAEQDSTPFIDLWSIYKQFVVIFSVQFQSGLHLCLHNIFQTQPIEFPIMRKHASEENKCLSDGLSCSDHQLLQNLAFLDLSRLSQHDKKRRLQLYSLSIPGRHPVYWQAIVGECLSQLDRHVSTLGAHVYSVLDGSYMQTVGERMAGRNRDSQAARPRTVSIGNTFTRSPPHSPSYSPQPPSSLLSSPFMTSMATTPSKPSSRLRCASLSLTGQQNTSAFLSPPGQPPKNYSSYTRGDRQPTIFDNMLKSIKQSRPVSYFFSEILERKNRKMFADAQKYVWLVQGLSSLALHSFEEDQYGVVQRDLPVILNSLLAFYEVLCKPLPMSAPSKKCSSYESKLKVLLKSEVKSAIYKITVTFKDGLSSMETSAEHLNRLNMFRDLKE